MKCEGAMRKRNAHTNAERTGDVDKLRGKDVLRFYSRLMCMKNMQQKIQLTGNPANFSGCKSEMNRSDGLLQRLELQTPRRLERSAAIERFERFESPVRKSFTRHLQQNFVPSLDGVGVVVAR
jgi:hypothetical protein